MEKELQSNTKVRFQDCDPFRHLNNSKYIDYFMNAREDQIEEHYGLNILQHSQTTGEAWVVSSNQISYLKPAVLEEKLTIKTRLLNYDQRSLHVEMEMYDAATGQQLKAICWTRFFYVNISKNRLASHPDDLMELFASVAVHSDHKTFEQRVRASLN